MSRRHVAPFLFGGLIIALVPSPPPANGCAVVPNRDGSVAVADEVALIVYDEGTKTEHFIRKATFQSTSADFGFLVPTPTLPELVEASGDMFAALSKQTEPKVEVRRVEQSNFGCAGAPNSKFEGVAADVSFKAAAPGGVEVAQKVNVAGYEAVSLKADDPQKLNEWLGRNGYVSRPSLIDWFKWYTDHKWVITAFKLGEGAQTAGGGRFRIDNRLVRMSFQTDRPFYPYREPADAAAQAGLTSDRLLRVYLLASAKSRGRIGDGPDSTDWPGRTVWAGLTDQTTLDRIGPASKLANINADRAWVLTEFEDRSYPRPATDEVYFGPDPDPSPVERPKRIEYVYVDVTNQRLAAIGILAGILPLVAIVGVVVALKLLRKK